MTKTTFAKQADQLEAQSSWRIVDASQQILGRMATEIAEVLMGKRNPRYTPHVCVGEGVIVINAEKVKTTGNKHETREYTYYTGYNSGLKRVKLGDYRDNNPEEMINLTVRRMLPKNAIGKQMLSRLKVYRGAEHPHAAQKPVEWNPTA